MTSLTDGLPLTDKEPETWTTEGFLEHFSQIHRDMEDRAFCFLLGAGASVTSRIKTGAELVDQWLQELCRRVDPAYAGDPAQLESWATAEHLGIPDFEYTRRAEFYPHVFKRRFPEPEEGYAYLEAVMKTATPSLGYSVLARILTDTRHRVVVTTNFDDLVAHSVFMYSKQRTAPLVCGHESLTPFVRAQLRRPLVAKIHNDLLFAPKNAPDEVGALAPGWKKALTGLFRCYNPIVIGYGGNDGSLMGFLESLERGAVAGRMIWCYYYEKPRWPIRQVVARHHGVLVKIDGFDQLMVRLGNQLDYGQLTDTIKQRNDDLLAEYSREFARYQRLVAPVPWPAELRRTVEGAEWWKWVWLAEQEPEAADREKWLRYGIDEFPESPELRGNYAICLEQAGNHPSAEEEFGKAVELGRGERVEPGRRKRFEEVRGNWPKFKELIQDENEKAEQCYFQRPDAKRSDVELVELLKKAAVRDAQPLFEAARENGNPRVLADVVGFLLEYGNVEYARETAERAWGLIGGPPGQFAAEIALYRGLIARLEGQDDRGALARVKTLIGEEYERSPFSLDRVFEASDQFPQEPLPLYKALAEAIGNAEKVPELDKSFPWWKKIEPIPADTSWLAEAESTGDQASEADMKKVERKQGAAGRKAEREKTPGRVRKA